MEQLALTLIRTSIGGVMVIFGLSQMVKPAYWERYEPSWLKKLLPISSSLSLRIHGVGNFGLGLMYMLGINPVLFSWLVAIWWLSILPFALWDDIYVGLRDVAIIAAVFAGLALLR